MRSYLEPSRKREGGVNLNEGVVKHAGSMSANEGVVKHASSYSGECMWLSTRARIYVICCAAGQLAHFTAASTFAGFDHRVLLCSMCSELTDPSAMVYAEAFKFWY